MPADKGHLGFDAPIHALIPGSPGEKDNRIEVVSAPRFGLVGSEQNVEIKDMPELRLGSVRHVGPYNRIPEAFQRLREIAVRASLGGPGTNLLAIYHDQTWHMRLRLIYLPILLSPSSQATPLKIWGHARSLARLR